MDFPSTESRCGAERRAWQGAAAMAWRAAGMRQAVYAARLFANIASLARDAKNTLLKTLVACDSSSAQNYLPILLLEMANYRPYN